MRTQDNTAHRACVITPGQVFYGNGAMTVIRPDLHTDLAAILTGTLGRFEPHATIVIDDVPLAVLEAHSDAITAAGWAHTRMGPWTVYRHNGGARTVAVGLRAAMHPATHFGVLLRGDSDPGTMAVLIDRYNKVTGTAWRGTAATTALNGIRSTWGNDSYQPLWHHPHTRGFSGAGPLVWSRDLNADEASWGHVHTWDTRSAYLGAAGMAEVAWSGLDTTGPQMFDSRLPGYWLLRLDDATLATLADPGRPPLLNPRSVRDGCASVTTPYAKLLQDLGDRCEVIDSLTGSALYRADGSRIHPAQSRIFRRWADMMKRARAEAETYPAGALRDQLLYAIQRTYKDATGGMQREGMRISREDWAHTLIDLSRACLYRLAVKIRATEGVWPVEVRTDSLSYADGPNWQTLDRALGGSTRATIRYQGGVTTEQWQAAHQPKAVRRGAR